MDNISLYIIPFIAWSLPWKAVALWKAAKNDDKIWFSVIFIVNTLGILDILYIFILSKGNTKEKNA